LTLIILIYRILLDYKKNAYYYTKMKLCLSEPFHGGRQF
jgi:hypothetical protein